MTLNTSQEKLIEEAVIEAAARGAVAALGCPHEWHYREMVRHMCALADNLQSTVVSNAAQTSDPSGAATQPTSQFTRKEGDGTPNVLDLIRAQPIDNVKALFDAQAAQYQEALKVATDALEKIRGIYGDGFEVDNIARVSLARIAEITPRP